MKRIISYSISSLVLGGLVAYCIYLMTQGSLVVTPDLIGKETIVGVGLIVFYIIIWFFATIGANRLNKPKLILGTLSVLMILTGAYLVVDTAEHITFLSDITRIVGVYLLIATFAGFVGISDGSTGTSSGRIKNVEIIEI